MAPHPNCKRTTIMTSGTLKWLNGWSAAAVFEGQFSNVTNSYAGKGIARYSW